MYVFLLALGALATAAGLVLVASGVSIQEHAFDPTNATAGTIAVIGGCILIGLALVVRALLRVERALVARPIAYPARPGETAAAALATPAETARIPFPPKPKSAPSPQPAGDAVAASQAPADDAALERLREKFPQLERLESAPVVEETDVSLLPKVPTPNDEDARDTEDVQAPVAKNGTAHLNGSAPAKTLAQVESKTPPPGRPERAKSSIFDSLWPKAQAQRTAAAVAVAPAPAPQPVPAPPPPSHGLNGNAAVQVQTAAAQPAVSAPVSILKSGVVEGMAYTLYSDGSIEAQLPQGTLRFGSITDLRNHIEQHS
jgi:hypothetical protein